MTTISNPFSIKSILVEKLFGIYTYKIPFDKKADMSKLLILYGDNGSGKTTILKLLFWLLSSRDKSGYKSKIAATRFKKFSIVFENNLEIGALRKDKNINGSFTYYIRQSNEEVLSLDLKADDDNSINFPSGSKDELTYQTILKYIRSLNISVFYLSDDRKILNSLTSSENLQNDSNLFTDEQDLIFQTKDLEKIALSRMLNKTKLSIEPAIDQLNNWIRNTTIAGSLIGEKNSQVIFTEIIKNITKSIEKDKKIKPKTKEALLTEIEDIENKIGAFIEFGLIEDFDSKTIKTSIKKSKTRSQLNYFNTILTPYIESINAKLNALNKLKETLQLLLNSINDYFYNKKIYYNLNTGFILKHINGSDIDFNWLSSGEKQLLLLFINTIISADQATIFIIDEPEISLNIKWQRKLIDTLLNFIVDKNVQYVLATHSLELLSSNVQLVSKLEDKDGVN